VGIFAAIAVMAAPVNRKKTGKGFIDQFVGASRICESDSQVDGVSMVADKA
jgi:hypothetical protein